MELYRSRRYFVIMKIMCALIIWSLIKKLLFLLFQYQRSSSNAIFSKLRLILSRLFLNEEPKFITTFQSKVIHLYI